MKFSIDSDQPDETVKAKLLVDEDDDLVLQLSQDGGKNWIPVHVHWRVPDPVLYRGGDCGKDVTMSLMSPKYAWDYIGKYIKPDGWGQDGPYISDHMEACLATIEEALFVLKGLEK